MGIDRVPGLAIWRQIVESLEQDIRSGIFAPGGRFLTEVEIASRFGVNRHTARRTVAELAQRGLVRVERGHGTFVEDALISYPVGKRTSFSANLVQQKREPGHRIVEREEQEANKDIASALAVRPKAPVYVLETVGEANGIPISVSTNYFPAERFQGLLERYAQELSISKVMKHYGIAEIVRRETRVTAEIPSTDDARLLRQLRTRPVLVAQSIDVDSEGVPISCNRVRFSAERVQLVFDFNQPDLSRSKR